MKPKFVSFFFTLSNLGAKQSTTPNPQSQPPAPRPLDLHPLQRPAPHLPHPHRLQPRLPLPHRRISSLLRLRQRRQRRHLPRRIKNSAHQDIQRTPLPLALHAGCRRGAADARSDLAGRCGGGGVLYCVECVWGGGWELVDECV